MKSVKLSSVIRLVCCMAVTAVAAVALSAAAARAPVSNGNPSATGDYVRSNGAHMVINAIKHKDGTTTGEMRYESADGGQIIIVAVDNVIFVGNSAYIHGIVTADTYGGLIGFHSYHHVVDNGEGANDPSDRASIFRNSKTPLDPITSVASTFAINSGNIQVRDR